MCSSSSIRRPCQIRLTIHTRFPADAPAPRTPPSAREHRPAASTTDLTDTDTHTTLPQLFDHSDALYCEHSHFTVTPALTADWWRVWRLPGQHHVREERGDDGQHNPQDVPARPVNHESQQRGRRSRDDVHDTATNTE